MTCERVKSVVEGQKMGQSFWIMTEKRLICSLLLAEDEGEITLSDLYSKVQSHNLSWHAARGIMSELIDLGLVYEYVRDNVSQRLCYRIVSGSESELIRRLTDESFP